MSLDRQFLQSKSSNEQSPLDIKFGVRMKKVPPSAKLKDVKKLFKGITVKNIFFQRGGTAIVVLPSEDAIEKALKRDGAAIGKHKVAVRQLTADTKKKGKNDSKFKREFFAAIPQKKLAEDIEDGGRLYIRNLSYECSEKDLDELFAPFGLLTEVHLPYDSGLKRNKGFGFVTFMYPKDAVKAFKKLDKTEFQNRRLHILPSRESTAPDPNDEAEEEQEHRGDGDSSFKKAKLAQLKREAGKASHTWNPLFVNPTAVAEVQAQEMGVSKERLLDSNTKGSAAVRLAQVELALLGEIEEFLNQEGVHVEDLKKASKPDEQTGGLERSRSVFLIKNLPAFTTADDLRPLLTPHGDLQRLEVSPKGVIAIAEFRQSLQARRAFAHVAFSQFKDSLLKTEWAPLLPRKRHQDDASEKEMEEPSKKRRGAEMDDSHPKAKKTKENEKTKKKAETSEKLVVKNADELKSTKSNVILVKNVPFQANQRELQELFQPFGSLSRVRLPKKTGGGIRGFAFVEFEDDEAAQLLLGADKKLHLYGRRLRMEPALAETDLSQMRASAFESVVTGEDAVHRERRKKKAI